MKGFACPVGLIFCRTWILETPYQYSRDALEHVAKLPENINVHSNNLETTGLLVDALNLFSNLFIWELNVNGSRKTATTFNIFSNRSRFTQFYDTSNSNFFTNLTAICLASTPFSPHATLIRGKPVSSSIYSREQASRGLGQSLRSLDQSTDRPTDSTATTPREDDDLHTSGLPPVNAGVNEPSASVPVVCWCFATFSLSQLISVIKKNAITIIIVVIGIDRIGEACNFAQNFACLDNPQPVCSNGEASFRKQHLQPLFHSWGIITLTLGYEPVKLLIQFRLDVNAYRCLFISDFFYCWN